MKKKKLYLTAFLLVLALALQGGIFSGFSVPVQAAATSKKQTGFVKKNGSWYYYENYQKKTGWLQLGEDWYYLKEDGKTAANESCQIGDVMYSFAENGVWIP